MAWDLTFIGVLVAFDPNTADQPKSVDLPNPADLRGRSAEDLDPAQWLDRFGDKLYRYAYLRLGRREVAEDLVQETLLAGIKGRKDFEGRSTVQTWLTGILKNKVIDYLRKKSSLMNYEDPYEPDSEFNRLGIWNTIFSDWARSPDELLQSKQFMGVLQQCLQGLTPRGRSAFILATVDGVPTEEICKTLEVTQGNLWVVLHRARMALRKCVEANWLSKPSGTA